MIRSFCWAVVAVILTASQSHAALIASYNFNESSGTTAADSVGGINGTLGGAASFVAGGISGNAINTTGGFVDMGNNFAFAAGPFSIELWVKMSPGDPSGAIPVSKHESGFGNGYFVGIGNVGDGAGGAGGQVHLYEGGSPVTALSSILVNDGQWHQIVGTFDGAASSNLFIDGVLAATGGYNGMITNSASFLVGGINVGGSPANLYSGLVDNLRLYDTSLSTGEVVGIYNDTIGGPTPVPEPGSLTMAGFGIVGMAVAAFRRRRAASAATASSTVA